MTAVSRSDSGPTFVNATPQVTLNVPAIRPSRSSSDWLQELLLDGENDSFHSDVSSSGDPARRKIQSVMRELLSTEITYVQSLCELEDGYLVYLREDSEVDQKVIDTIFGRIPKLRVFHETLMHAIRLHQNDLIQLAETFLEHSEEMKSLYADFCVNFSKSEMALKKEQEDQTQLWCKLTTRQQAMGYMLPLSTYLLTPVQRILRYQLMFKECLKHCSTTGFDDDSSSVNSEEDEEDSSKKIMDAPLWMQEARPVIQRARDRLVEIADYLNERKRSNELLERLHTEHWKVDRLGDLVLQGTFRMRGKRGTWFVLLFHGAILLCKQETSTLDFVSGGRGSDLSRRPSFTRLGGQSQYMTNSKNKQNPRQTRRSCLSEEFPLDVREVISCSNLMIIECIPKDPLAFQVLAFDAQKSQKTLVADTLQEKLLWCREIKRLILENYSATVPERAKDLVLNTFEMPSDKMDSSTDHGLSHDRLVFRSRRRRRGDPRKTHSSVPVKRRGRSADPTLSRMRSWFIDESDTPIPEPFLSRTKNSRTLENEGKISLPVTPDWTDHIPRRYNDTQERMFQDSPQMRKNEPRMRHEQSETCLDYRCIAIDVNRERIEGTTNTENRKPSNSESTTSDFTLGHSEKFGEESSPYIRKIFINYDNSSPPRSSFHSRTYDQYIKKLRGHRNTAPNDMNIIVNKLEDCILDQQNPKVHRSNLLYRMSPPGDHKLFDDSRSSRPIPLVGCGEATLSDTCPSSGDSSPSQVVSRIALRPTRQNQSDRVPSYTATRQLQMDGVDMTNISSRSKIEEDFWFPIACGNPTTDVKNGMRERSCTREGTNRRSVFTFDSGPHAPAPPPRAPIVRDEDPDFPKCLSSQSRAKSDYIETRHYRLKSQPPSKPENSTRMLRKKSRAPSPPMCHAPLAEFDSPHNTVCDMRTSLPIVNPRKSTSERHASITGSARKMDSREFVIHKPFTPAAIPIKPPRRTNGSRSIDSTFFSNSPGSRSISTDTMTDRSSNPRTTTPTTLNRYIDVSPRYKKP